MACQSTPSAADGWRVYRARLLMLVFNWKQGEPRRCAYVDRPRRGRSDDLQPWLAPIQKRLREIIDTPVAPVTPDLVLSPPIPRQPRHTNDLSSLRVSAKITTILLRRTSRVRGTHGHARIPPPLPRPIGTPWGTGVCEKKRLSTKFPDPEKAEIVF